MKHFLIIPTLLAAAGALNAAEKAADKSGHTFFNPTPKEQMRELSTDRPDTTESPYSVDAGHIQVEIEAVSWTRDTIGDETTTTLNGSINAKLGLTNAIDLQAVLDPYVNVKTKDKVAGTATSNSGVGDFTARLKCNLWGNDGGPTAFAIMPFVTFPTHSKKLDANREVTGGVILPLGVDLGEGWSMGVMLEVDAVRNAANDSYVAEWVTTITVSHDIVGDLGGFLEVVNTTSAERQTAGTAYFDAGLTFAFNPDVQFDLGTNLGLTSASDDVRLFLGISVRR
jgi:hypothetical protein